MDASSASSVCGVDNCISSWTLSCLEGGSYVQVYSGTGDNVTWTSGNGGGFTIDTSNVTAPMPCNATLNYTDASDASSEAAAQFSVLPNPPAAEVTSNGTQVVAGQTATMDATNSTCFNAPCDKAWAVSGGGKVKPTEHAGWQAAALINPCAKHHTAANHV